ncbi:hypothetical protein DRN58_00980 [Thermococci archaeon]|nr:MAG: hypothetical protein DRN58_00980 [Thermococci archaeon]
MSSVNAETTGEEVFLGLGLLLFSILTLGAPPCLGCPNIDLPPRAVTFRSGWKIFPFFQPLPYLYLHYLLLIPTHDF